MLDPNKQLRSVIIMSAPRVEVAHLSSVLEPTCRDTAAHALTMVRDGVIKEINVESGGEFRVSSAEYMLAQL